MRIKALIVTIAALSAAGSAAFAQQQPQTPEQREKQLYELVQKQVDSYAESLNLEGWQIFYADSILTHDFKAMAEEYENLSNNRVDNPTLYSMIQDKWMEASYQAFQKILTPEQWNKYLKHGAARDKKARDKRAAKRAAQQPSAK